MQAFAALHLALAAHDLEESFEAASLLEERHSLEQHVCAEARTDAADPCPVVAWWRAPASFASTPKVLDVPHALPALITPGARLAAAQLAPLTLAPKASPPGC